MPKTLTKNNESRENQHSGKCFSKMTLGSVIICNLTTVPIIQFFAFVFRDLADSLELTTLQSSIVLVLQLSISFFLNVFIKLIPSQISGSKVSFFGAAITFVGFCGLAFAKSYYQVLISYGILIAIGTKLVIGSCGNELSLYSVDEIIQKLTLVFLAVGYVYIPLLIVLLLSIYTTRETIFILGAVSSHLFVAAFLLIPTENHISQTTKNASDKEIKVLMVPTNVDINNSQKDVKEQQNHFEHVPKEIEERKPFLGRNEIVQPIPVSSILPIQNSKNKYLKLLTSPRFMCVTIGFVCNSIAEGVFGFLLPFMLIDFNFPIYQIGIALSTFTGSMMSLKYACTFVFSFNWSPTVLSIMSIISLILSRIAIALGFIKSFGTLMIAASFIGSSKGVLLAFIENINPSKFSEDLLPYVTNIQNLSNAFALLTFGPILGYLRDLFGTYQYTMLCINILNSTCIFFWMMELLLSLIGKLWCK